MTDVPDLAPDRPAAWPAEARAVVAGWLIRVGTTLVGPRRWRAGILAELTDGLYTAAEARVRAGEPPLSAARAAVAEFGDPVAVAAACRREGLAAQAGRTGAGLLLSGPAAATVWLGAFAASAAPVWHGVAAGPWVAMPLFGALLAVVVPAATLALPYPRRLVPPARRWSPQTCAVTAAAGCAAADALMMGMFTLWLVGHPPVGTWTAAVLAVGFSGTRLVLACRAAWVCRAAVTPVGGGRR